MLWIRFRVSFSLFKKKCERSFSAIWTWFGPKDYFCHIFGACQSSRSDHLFGLKDWAVRLYFVDHMCLYCCIKFEQFSLSSEIAYSLDRVVFWDWAVRLWRSERCCSLFFARLSKTLWIILLHWTSVSVCQLPMAHLLRDQSRLPKSFHPSHVPWLSNAFFLWLVFPALSPDYPKVSLPPTFLAWMLLSFCGRSFLRSVPIAKKNLIPGRSGLRWLLQEGRLQMLTLWRWSCESSCSDFYHYLSFFWFRACLAVWDEGYVMQQAPVRCLIVCCALSRRW